MKREYSVFRKSLTLVPSIDFVDLDIELFYLACKRYVERQNIFKSVQKENTKQVSIRDISKFEDAMHCNAINHSTFHVHYLQLIIYREAKWEYDVTIPTKYHLNLRQATPHIHYYTQFILTYDILPRSLTLHKC